MNDPELKSFDHSRSNIPLSLEKYAVIDNINNLVDRKDDVAEEKASL